MKKYLSYIGLTIVFITSLILIFNKPIRNRMIGEKSNSYQVSKVNKKTLEKNKDADVTYDFDAVKPVNATNVVHDTVTQESLPVIAGIAVPELGINLPIFKGMGNDELTYGAGTMKPDQVMGEGNYALASHHIFDMIGASNMLFSPLERAKTGMLVYLTDKENVYTYKINNVTIVEPTAVEVIDDVPNKKLLTLVTCDTLEASGRIIVQGELVNIEPYIESNDKSVFNTQYNQ